MQLALSQRRGNTTSFHHFDALGSTERLTDSSQAALISYLYRAFGEQSVLSGSHANPLTWVGRLGYYRQGDSADYWLRARVYRPTVGRFASRDPLRADWNSYRYAWNSAVLHTDPSGLADCVGQLRDCVYDVFGMGEQCREEALDQLTACLSECILSLILSALPGISLTVNLALSKPGESAADLMMIVRNMYRGFRQALMSAPAHHIGMETTSRLIGKPLIFEPGWWAVAQFGVCIVLCAAEYAYVASQCRKAMKSVLPTCYQQYARCCDREGHCRPMPIFLRPGPMMRGLSPPSMRARR